MHVNRNSIRRKKPGYKRKTSDKLGDEIKYHKDMRETADYIRWDIKKIHHKEQELTWNSFLIVKNHILKKCPGFYKFEDILHKYPSINLSLIIKSGQPPRYKGVIVDKNNLKGYDFDLNLNFKDFCKTTLSEKEKKDKKDIDISFLNSSNIISDSNLSLHSIFSQIT